MTNSPDKTPSFNKLQMHARHAAATKELVDKGISCVAGIIDTETGEMVFSTPNLEHLFDQKPELRDALESKLRRTLFNDADPTTSL
jgi:hypothetical protein